MPTEVRILPSPLSEKDRRTMICGSSSGGRARAFQARGRGFDSRLPLHSNYGGEAARGFAARGAGSGGIGGAERGAAARAAHGPPGMLAHVAHSAEHFLGKEEVTGSNPV